jgi:putative membrane protein
MLRIHHTAIGFSSLSSLIVLALVLISFLYVQGWRGSRRAAANAIPTWRLTSFLLGVSLVWGALGSPLAAYEHELLTVHMVQHLLLMTFAPALIMLGEPLLAFRQGWTRLINPVFGPLFQSPFLQRLVRMPPRPTLCWTVSALTLLGWHVPALFTLGMRSAVWHSVEQASFFGAGFLFWWPVIQPWPSVSTWAQWSTLLYLFAATLPCDILSGFLVFSDRVAYPLNFKVPRHSGFSVLEDQQCAAALMWTCITIAYLVPAAILSVRLLSPRSFDGGVLVQSGLRSSTSAQAVRGYGNRTTVLGKDPVVGGAHEHDFETKALDRRCALHSRHWHCD